MESCTSKLRLSLFLALLCGCQSTPTPPPEKTSAAAKALPEGISEKDFIALHEHKDGKAPKLKGELIQIGGQRAYLSLPEGKAAPLPAVLMIHEWWGLNEHIMHWADRLAAEGYAAIALDLYRGKATKDRDEAYKLMQAVDEAESLRVLAAGFDFASQDPRIQATKRASIGWCFGGAWSLKYAMSQPLDASVIYYGRLINDPGTLQEIKGKILGVFGNQDQGIPPEQVNLFQKALEQAKVEHKILRYDANHAFANPSSGRYDEGSATAAWVEVQRFLAEALK